MPISEKSHKIIWGQFSARCAICKKDVIHETDGGTKSLIGEVAHIVGEKKDAARGLSSLSLDDRNDPDNLILLCREHHKIIDDAPEEYTTRHLHEIKNNHLDWIQSSLKKHKPWKSNLSQLSYINVPRLSEQAQRNGFHVNLSEYKENRTLHSLGWNLNSVMSAFQSVLSHLELSAVPIPPLTLNEGYIGSLVSFDRLRFRTKNVPMDAISVPTYTKQVFCGNLQKDPHIYVTLGDFKLVLLIDAQWITTSTAFTMFRPSSGQSTFSGVARITNVDYESRVMTATGLVIGVPRSQWDEMCDENPERILLQTNVSPHTAANHTLDALVDMDEARRRLVYFAPPPDNCDLCDRQLREDKYMIDGRVKDHGYWACMCSTCFRASGTGIGVGKGQLYLRNENGWLEVAGFVPRSTEEGT